MPTRRYEYIWAIAYIMWDIDNDNNAEVIARIKENNNCYLIAYDGLTGAEKGRIKWPDVLDDYNDRHVIAIAYLDGTESRPSVILQVGTYREAKLSAYDYTDSNLKLRWAKQNLGDGTTGHGIDIVDYNNDGKDEILQGSTLVDGSGNVVWSANLGHVDVMVPGDINPENPGLEIFYGTCSPLDAPQKGTFLIDMDNGSTIWKHTDETESNLWHLHGGWAADVSNAYPGWEAWIHNKPRWGSNKDDQPYLYNGVSGEIIMQEWITNQELISWDDDDQKELTIIYQGCYRIFEFPSYETGNILDCEGAILLIMDLVGDFRDELVMASGNSFYIWTNTDLSKRRKISPLFDRHYRLDVARSGSGYYRHSSVLYLNQNLFNGAVDLPPSPPTGVSIRIP